MGHQNLISDLKTSPQNPYLPLANVQKKLRQKGGFSTASGSRNHCELTCPYSFHLLVEIGQPTHLGPSVDFFIHQLLFNALSQSVKFYDVRIWDGSCLVQQLTYQAGTFHQKVIGVLEFCNCVFDYMCLSQPQFLCYFGSVENSGLVIVHPEDYTIKTVEVWQKYVRQIGCPLRQGNSRIASLLVNGHSVKFSLSNNQHIISIFDQMVSKETFRASQGILPHVLFGFSTCSSHLDLSQLSPVVFVSKVTIPRFLKFLYELFL